MKKIGNKIKALMFGAVLVGGGVLLPSTDLPILAADYEVEYSGRVSAGVPFSFISDSISIGPNSQVMIHLARTSDGEMLSLDDPFQMDTIAFLDRRISKYLTTNEMGRILLGEDVIVAGSVMQKRVDLGQYNIMTIALLALILDGD